jgi:hypothetical protein
MILQTCNLPNGVNNRNDSQIEKDDRETKGIEEKTTVKMEERMTEEEKGEEAEDEGPEDVERDTRWSGRLGGRDQ